MGELLRMMVQSSLPKSSLQKFPVAEIFLCAARLENGNVNGMENGIENAQKAPKGCARGRPLLPVHCRRGSLSLYAVRRSSGSAGAASLKSKGRYGGGSSSFATASARAKDGAPGHLRESGHMREARVQNGKALLQATNAPAAAAAAAATVAANAAAAAANASSSSSPSGRNAKRRSDADEEAAPAPAAAPAAAGQSRANKRAKPAAPAPAPTPAPEEAPMEQAPAAEEEEEPAPMDDEGDDDDAHAPPPPAAAAPAAFAAFTLSFSASFAAFSASFSSRMRASSCFE